MSYITKQRFSKHEIQMAKEHLKKGSKFCNQGNEIQDFPENSYYIS